MKNRMSKSEIQNIEKCIKRNENTIAKLYIQLAHCEEWKQTYIFTQIAIAQQNIKELSSLIK